MHAGTCWRLLVQGGARWRTHVIRGRRWYNYAIVRSLQKTAFVNSLGSCNRLAVHLCILMKMFNISSICIISTAVHVQFDACLLNRRADSLSTCHRIPHLKLVWNQFQMWYAMTRGKWGSPTIEKTGIKLNKVERSKLCKCSKYQTSEEEYIDA